MESTTKYTLFSHFEGNRVINQHHVNKLKTSLQEHGYLKAYPIIVDEELRIIDGQHRFEACKQLGLPIHFVVQKNAKEDLLVNLNILQKKWTTNDYVAYYALQKQNPHYIRLIKLLEDTHIDVASVLELAKGRELGGSYLGKVKAGELELDNTECHKVRITCDNVRTLTNTLHFKPTGRLCRAINVMQQQPNFSWTTLLEKAKNYRAKAYPCSTKQEWLDMLTDLYNHNIKNLKNKLIIKE